MTCHFFRSKIPSASRFLYSDLASPSSKVYTYPQSLTHIEDSRISEQLLYQQLLITRPENPVSIARYASEVRLQLLIRSSGHTVFRYQLAYRISDNSHVASMSMDLMAPNSAHTPTPPVDDCAICREPLCVPTHDAGLLPTSIIELACSHRFHLDCLSTNVLTASDATFDKCPYCRASAFHAQGKYVVIECAKGGYGRYISLPEYIEQTVSLKAKLDVKRRAEFLDAMKAECYETAERYLSGDDVHGHGQKLDPNVKTESGDTAMHSAALYNRVEGIRLLLRYGAEKNIRNNKGETPLNWAQTRVSRDAIALLSLP